MGEVMTSAIIPTPQILNLTNDEFILEQGIKIILKDENTFAAELLKKNLFENNKINPGTTEINFFNFDYLLKYKSKIIIM